jgi:methyltransferase (TIGR00027 family)
MSDNNRTSETAIVTASLRALSNYEKDENINCHDSLAELFLPDDRKVPLHDSNSREMIKKAIPKGMYEYVIARTKYFDYIFIESLKNNIEQIVFLGAGYDSRPYRFSHLIENASIYEVDAKPTQDHKISLLQKNNTYIHKNIKYVPVDFEVDNFIRLICENGFDKFKTTLFLCEGVTFYLSGSAVEEVLKLIKENSGIHSRICFDFQTKINNELIDTGLKDEVIKFGIEPGKIEEFVKNSGFSLVEHVKSTDMEKRFLTLENWDLFGWIVPIMNFALIERV